MIANKGSKSSFSRGRRLSVASAAGVALALLAACGGSDSEGGGAASETITLRYATYESESNPVVQEVEGWMSLVKERVEADTEHSIDFEMFYNSELLDPTEMLSGLQEGRADMTYLPTLIAPAEFALHQLATVPFLSTNPAAARQTWSELARTNADAKAEWEAQGAVPLLWGLAGNTAAGFKEPVESLEDLEGLRVRSIGLHALAWKEVGVEPIALTAPEVYEAMERGVIDGWTGSPIETAAGNYRYDEVSEQVIDPGLGQFVNAATATISQQSWDGLPEDVQDIMLEVAAEVESDSSPDVMERERERICSNIEESGASLVPFNEAEVSKWQDLVGDKVLEAWVASTVEAGATEEAARSLIDEFTDLHAKFESDSTYEDTFDVCLKEQ